MTPSTLNDVHFVLSLLADRFVCGGSALTMGRGISRKRLALIDALPTYPDKEASLLSKEIAAYRRAKSVLNSEQSLNTKTLLQAHACFHSKKFKMGRIRTTQNWIGESLEKARYVPPSPGEITPLLSEWFNGVNSENNSLEKAILHYAKFVLLHPFPDGNGRVARAIFDVLTTRLNEAVLPLAFYRLHVDESRYISALHAFGTKTDLAATHDYWIEAITWSKKIHANAKQIIQSSQQNMRSKLGMFAMTHEEAQMLNYLWMKPIVTPSLLQQTFKWNNLVCETLLQKFCHLGLLTAKRLKHSNNQLIFVCEAVFQSVGKTDALILNK